MDEHGILVLTYATTVDLLIGGLDLQEHRSKFQ